MSRFLKWTGIVLLLVVIGIGLFVYRTFFAPLPDWDRSSMQAHLSEACFEQLDVQKTAAGLEYVQTPKECFDGLPNWDHEAQFVEIDGLKQGYVEAGPKSGETILLLHGQPSWSYLYRFMIEDLSERGYRVIAMDHLGFGLSDKPIQQSYHSFTNHADRLIAFMDALDLKEVNLFAQDWGSIIGLYVVADNQDRFSRVIIGNGGIPVVLAASKPPENVEATNARFGRMIRMMPKNQPALFDDEGNPTLPIGEGEGSDPFGEWVAYAETSLAFQPSQMVEALTFDALTDEERAAYDAPFPSELAMAGPRSFPRLRNELIGLTEDRKIALTKYEKPFLTIFGGNDPGLVGEGDGQPFMMNEIPGAIGQPHHRFKDASHFLQDDKGPEVARMVDAFIQSTQ